MISVKKNLTTLGYVMINNHHPFGKSDNGFQISARLQELMTYAGQMDRYDNCNEVLKQFLNIEVSSTQVYRVADYYGHQLENTLHENRIIEPVAKDEVLYAQADGSMILTREDGWNEVKLGRIFKSSDCIHANENKGWITHSQYLAHLGGHKEFCNQMDTLLDDFGSLEDRLVFITDGAPWLKNWIEDSFPQAVSILDYYHAAEHLHEFSSKVFKDSSQEHQWVERQKALLLDSKVETVIENIRACAGDKIKEADKLIGYYESNLTRMDYKKYRQIGCGLIGSGAIESAHRTVVQKRMKQSGQRWSEKGASNMLNLRVVKKNLQWDKVIALTKKNYARAA